MLDNLNVIREIIDKPEKTRKRVLYFGLRPKENILLYLKRLSVSGRGSTQLPWSFYLSS